MQHKAIFENLFGKDISDPANDVFLKELTDRHPYFTPAQFFLLQKTGKQSMEYDKQVLRTNILFNNPYWLNFQLNRPDNLEPIQIPSAKKELTQTTEPEKAIEVLHALPADDVDDTDMVEGTEPEKEIEPMKIELKMPAESSKLDESMLFEPMHVVDYFASQGIKLPDEVQSTDKLGKQLKSFTEWLKTMKKVHVPDNAEPALDSDDSIQHLAESSNADAEVLTESMAEVFARQGKTGKAVEVYQKLSLLNPAKSTYFAAKIENLKGI